MSAEAFKYRGVRTGFLALAALFVFAVEAGAQTSTQTTEPTPWLTAHGFRTYDQSAAPFTDETFETVTRGDLANAVVRNVSQQNPDVTPESAVTKDEDTEEVVVTAQRQEDFSSTVKPEFEENIFERMGIVTTGNADLEGLAFLTPEEKRDNGWAISVPVFGSRRGETGPFVSFEGGRDRIIAGGIRF